MLVGSDAWQLMLVGSDAWQLMLVGVLETTLPVSLPPSPSSSLWPFFRSTWRSRRFPGECAEMI